MAVDSRMMMMVVVILVLFTICCSRITRKLRLNGSLVLSHGRNS